MKPYILLLTASLFASCSGSKQANNAADENKKARNKEVAVKNEVTELTRLAQKLEQQGRGMDLLRKVKNPQSQSECAAQMEDAQKQLKDFEARVNNLPDNYKAQLTSITDDLNECIICSKTSTESCVKARASINKTIKEIYP